MTIPENLRVNLRVVNTAVPCWDPVFSWTLISDLPLIQQSEYRIRIRNAAEEKFTADTGFVESNRSAGIHIETWKNPLEPDTLYFWDVSLRDSLGDEYVSKEAAFITESAFFLRRPSGIWHPKDPDFCILRAPFECPRRKRYKILANITACSPEPSRQYVYNLYINGNFASLGPARYGKDAQGNTIVYYNCADITDLVESGGNTVAAIAYTSAERAFFCEIKAYYEDGTSETMINTAEPERWQTADASGIFRPAGSIGTGYYFAPAENFDAEAIEKLVWEYAEPACLPEGYSAQPYPAEPVKRFEIPAEECIVSDEKNLVFVDFGKEFIGGVRLEIDSPESAEITVRCGEELENGVVKYQMRTGNCYEEKWRLKKGQNKLENIGMKTLRYVEFLNLPAKPVRIWGSAIRQEFQEEASQFTSSSRLLNQLYDFTKYTIKATNQDLYVDSQSRERGAYEGDVLINLLSAYAVEDQYALARFSVSYLNTHRTWPAEYSLISVLMAWEDYLYTGDDALLRRDYQLLQSKIFAETFADFRGLYGRGILQAGNGNAVLVDWPHSERDGYAYDAAEYNTVLNCMTYKALCCLSKIARVLKKHDDAAQYFRRAEQMKASLISLLYNPEKGAFCDGLSAAHMPVPHFSQHASAFALYCGVYEDDAMRNALTAFLKTQGKIRMSVYGAFYLLEGLYAAGAGNYATELMLQEDVSEGARTWAYMLQNGATITTEAWNSKNKPNMTFSHPWGSAPASQIVRGLFGIRPLEPGFARFRICICSGPVQKASIVVPTVKGPIHVSFEKDGGVPPVTNMEITVPPNTEAELCTGERATEKIRLLSGTHHVRCRS